MDGRFLKAFSLLPRQRTVCGRTLLPLCLRHRLLLESIGSPFIDGANIPTPLDIVVFSRIVSTHSLKEATAPVSMDDTKHVDRMIQSIEEHAKQLEEANAFVAEQAHWPVYWKKDKASTKGIPWLLNVVANLVRNGVSLEEAWTMPESQAIWLSSVFSIADGADIDILSDEDIAMMEFAKRVEETAKAREAAGV